MSKLNDRIQAAAHKMYIYAYEAEFGGKTRGRFQVSRVDLKRLLGLSRLHPSTLRKFIDACLELGLVIVDMDDNFAFAEADFVSKWRKLPSRLVEEYATELDGDEDEDDDDGNTDADADEDEDD